MKKRSDYNFPFSRYPALRIALLFAAGIVLFTYTESYFKLHVVIFISLLLIYCVFQYIHRRKWSLSLSRVINVIYLMLVIFLGVMRSGSAVYISDPLVNWADAAAWENLMVSGVVSVVSTSASGKYRIQLKTDSIGIKGQLYSVKHLVLISADSSMSDPQAGDILKVWGRIMPVSDKRNPHDFDYAAYLRSQGISFQMIADSISKIEKNNSLFSWIYWRNGAIRVLENNFDASTAPIAKALILGYKQDLSRDDKTAFARVGLSHIMAVSGLHVGFIIAPFWMIIPWFWGSKKGKSMGLGILITILFLYAGITGFSASVLRASLMAGLLTYGKLFHKNSDPLNLMGAAGLILLIIDPEQLWNIGFQLSFSAVLVILIVLPVIQSQVPVWMQRKWQAKPIMVVIVSLVVQFGLFPLQVYYFGEISLVSPLANALFVPLLALIVPLALLAVIIGAVVPIAGIILNYPPLYFLRAMRLFVDQSLAWEWTWFQADGGGPMMFILWVFLLLLISSLKIPAFRWKWLIAVLLILNIMQAEQIFKKVKKPILKVTYLDVGQGDAALVQSPGGKSILIDTGVWTPSYNSGKQVIIPHLKKAGITHLDAVILSHPHADHIGGIEEIIGDVTIGRIINSGFEYESALYHRYLEKAEKNNIEIRKATIGDTLLIDRAVLVQFLGPDPHSSSSDPNQHSVIVKIVYGETSFLFTGDAGEQQEEDLVHFLGGSLKSEVLKVGHHGSRTSSSPSFIKSVAPDWSVISLGEGNKFRHPHKEALSTLYRHSDSVLITARDKAIILVSDAEQVFLNYWD